MEAVQCHFVATSYPGSSILGSEDPEGAGHVICGNLARDQLLPKSSLPMSKDPEFEFGFHVSGKWFLQLS